MKHIVLAVAVLLSPLALGQTALPEETLKVCRAAERAKKLGLQVSGNVAPNCAELLTKAKLESAKKRVAKLEAEVAAK